MRMRNVSFHLKWNQNKVYLHNTHLVVYAHTHTYICIWVYTFVFAKKKCCWCCCCTQCHEFDMQIVTGGGKPDHIKVFKDNVCMYAYSYGLEVNLNVYRHSQKKIIFCLMYSYFVFPFEWNFWYELYICCLRCILKWWAFGIDNLKK